jgi:beta-glucanase (GH16 family)
MQKIFQLSPLRWVLAFLLSSSFFSLLAQSLQDDFEGNGNITSWFGDDCQINVQFANPFSGPDNPSTQVLQYQDVGGTYANVRFDAGRNLNLPNYFEFSFKIYVPSSGLTGSQPNQVSLKLQDGNLGAPWSTQSEIIKPITLDQWQTVRFNFATDPYQNADPGSPAPTQRLDFNRVVIQVNGENNNDQVTAYLDDFYYFDSVQAAPNYSQLIWQDEFNGSGAIDTSKWFQQTLLPLGNSWYNGEIQHYTNRLANSSQSNGALQLIAKKETFTDQGVTKQYTSARLNSKFAFTYGRVVVRAKMPRGAGTWPAIWTLGKNIIEPGAYFTLQGFGTQPWPACGEMDIMEHWGNNQNYVASATHTPSSFGGTVNKGGQVIPTVSDSFHVYEMIWSPQQLIFKVDGVSHFTYNPPVKDANTWPFDSANYLLLNVAIEPSIDPNFTQDTMEVDYVRVYQDPSMVSLAEQKTALTSLPLFPNPVKESFTVSLPVKTAQEITVHLYRPDGALAESRTAYTQGSRFTLHNLDKLGRGLYFARFQLQGQNYQLKFSKQ